MASNEFGPLVEPGWPSTLPKAPDLGAKFLSAFAIGSQANARQQSLENQLARMTLQAQKMEYDRALDRDKFELAQQRLGLQADNAAARLDIANAQLGLKEQTTGLAITKYNDLIEGKSGLVEAQAILDSEGLRPGDKGYVERFNELTSKIIGKVPTSTLNAVQRNIYNNNNAASREKQKYLDSEWRHFVAEAGGILYGNANPPNPDLTPILHPESLSPETTGGGWFSGPEKTVPGKFLIPNAVDSAGNPTKRSVSMSDLTKLKKRYDDLMKVKDSIAPQVDRPDIGVRKMSGNYNVTPEGKVRVISPDGTHGSIPSSVADDYINNKGYTPE